MESNLNNRDFEQFVKQNADQYRMFPSEKVWNGIDKALHTRRKWYGLSLALLLLMTGAGVTWVMVTSPGNKDAAGISPSSKISQTTSPDKSSAIKEVPFIKENNIVASGKNKKVTFPSFLNETHSLKETVSADENNDVVSDKPLATTENDLDWQLERMSINKYPNAVPGAPQKQNPDFFMYPEIPFVEESKTAKVIEPSSAKNEVAENQTGLIFPWTIESVVNAFQKTSAKKKITWQLYFTPTISYRKLTENKVFLRAAAAAGNVPAYTAYYVDLKNVVTHKPDMGLELGLAAKYPITRALQIRAGFQFNVTRYDIRAFSSPSEVATIALDAAPGNNSISRETIYRTRSGSKENWLQNLYYSASLPIGLELKLSNKKKTNFSIASTIQPTYVISDKAYLISTDYKNYIEVPSTILRRLNFNTGVEALMGYSTNNFHWQIGPQVRYQIRSSFHDQYPVKENLFDFGLKVGVMLNK